MFDFPHRQKKMAFVMLSRRESFLSEFIFAILCGILFDVESRWKLRQTFVSSESSPSRKVLERLLIKSFRSSC